MKKNAIGHMTAPKESMGRRIRRWDILPRLICLLLAVMFWLLIVNAREGVQETPAPDPVIATESLV